MYHARSGENVQSGAVRSKCGLLSFLGIREGVHQLSTSLPMQEGYDCQVCTLVLH